ncbi:MAG: hypothetical protein ACFFFC_17215 [Candidatus Thorarchaeota archaeon]
MPEMLYVDRSLTIEAPSPFPIEPRRSCLGKRDPDDPVLSHSEEEQFFVIRNEHYIAKINRDNGELTYVLDPDNQIHVSGDRFYFTMTDMSTGVELDAASSELEPVWGPMVEPSYDFYLKVETRYKFEGPTSTLYIERTYEFTRSPHIYEQLSFYVSRASGELSPLPVMLDRLRWRIEAHKEDVNATITADDLMLSYPPSLRHWTPFTTYARFRTDFEKTTLVEGGRYIHSRTIIQDGKYEPQNGEIFGRYTSKPFIKAGRLFLANSVITIGKPEQTALQPSDFKNECFQFYPGLGLLSQPSGDIGVYLSEIDYCKLGDSANWLIPIRNGHSLLGQAHKDALIRLSMRLRDQMILDRWWPKMKKVNYPKYRRKYSEGEISVCYSRSFPMMVYVWALHTIHRDVANRWCHYQGDADVLYETLQELYAHYGPSSGVPHFEDYWPEKGVHYLSWCAGIKGMGIINSHADALHFAWLMREASELFGDYDTEKNWREVVEKYHRGSQELVSHLHPARYQGQEFWGILKYGFGGAKMEPWYTKISLQGIAAGYQQARSANIRFVDFVERAFDWDYCPHLNPEKEGGKEHYDGIEAGDGNWSAVFVAQLCRLLPACLSFVGKGATNYRSGMSNALRMSHYIRGGASIREVLTYAELLEAGIEASPHTDRKKFIVEGGDQQWILTNGDFKCFWVPGFWEEREPEDVPNRMRFEITPNPFRSTPAMRGVARWYTISRKGDSLFVMTNSNTNRPSFLKFPVRHLRYSIDYLEYDHDNHHWNYHQNVDSDELVSDGAEIRVPLGYLQSRFLYIIEIESNDY